VNPKEAANLLLESAGDDEKLTLAIVEVAVSAYAEDEQEGLREAIRAAAVPHWFDADILAALLEASVAEGARIYDVLKKLPFVEVFPARKASNIHERTRLNLLGRLARDDPEKYRELSARAAEYFKQGREAYNRVEAIYHLLIADGVTAGSELAGLSDEWRNQGRVEPLQALAATLAEHLRADRLSGSALSSALGVTATIESPYRPLQHTAERLRRALEINRQLGDQRSESVILDQLGDIQRALGRLTEALGSYRASFEIDEKLAARDPENTQRQRDLSISYNNIGAVQRALGQLIEALGSYRAGLAIAEKLAAHDPENSEWQRDLSISYNNVGAVQRALGQLTEALDSYRASLGIREKLAASDSANTQWQRDLSMCYDDVGAVQRALGQLTEALDSYRASLAIAEKLAAHDPENTQWQRDLSISYSNVGGMQRALGQLTEALDSYRASSAIAEKLAGRDPANTQWQRDLSVFRDNVGAVQKALSQGSARGKLR